MRATRSLFSLLVTSLCFAPFALAQLTNVTNDQQTPIPGAGLDYIKMFNETVNPANGSVSLRIDMEPPPSRRLNFPLALLYNSSGVYHAGYDINAHAIWRGDQTSHSGWTYSLPQLTAVEGFTTLYDGSAKPPQTYSCEYISNYMFQDVAGTRHLLNISMAQTQAGQTHCDLLGGSRPQNVLSGGDDFYLATTTAPGPAPFLPNPAL
jgi:hypothetical protein